MQSFLKMKPKRKGEISLSFTDAGKPSHSHKFLTSQICLLMMLFVKMFEEPNKANLSQFYPLTKGYFREKSKKLNPIFLNPKFNLGIIKQFPAYKTQFFIHNSMPYLRLTPDEEFGMALGLVVPDKWILKSIFS